MDSILGLELGAGASPFGGFGGVQTSPGGSLISLLQSGGFASQLGGASSPFAGASLGINAASLQQMMVQSLMSSFQSLNGIWGGIAGGGGLGGGVGSLLGQSPLSLLLGGAEGIGNLLGGGLGSSLGGGSLLGGLGSLGSSMSGFGGLGLLGGLGIPGFGAQLQGFGGLALPPLGGNPYGGNPYGGNQYNGGGLDLGLPPLPGNGGNGNGYGGGLNLPPLPGYDGGGGGPVNGPTDAAPINTNIDYKSLTTAQRNQLSGMTEEQRAELHLWGIQMGSSGKQDGGVLLNVLDHPEQFKPAEVAVAKRLAAEDKAKYGGITGKSLDQAFFGVYKQLTGKDISQRYANSPIHFATGEVNMANRQTGKNGLSQYENETLQLWGHSPLFTGGKIDGSILEYALNSKNTLEANLNKDDINTLLNADKTGDGVVDGGSLENTFIDTLDHIYNGGPAATQQRTMDEALNEAAKRRAGLLPPVNPKNVANSQEVNFFAQLFGSNDPSQCPFLNGGGGGAARLN